MHHKLQFINAIHANDPRMHGFLFFMAFGPYLIIIRLYDSAHVFHNRINCTPFLRERPHTLGLSPVMKAGAFI